MNWIWLGLLLIISGGAMQGSFALPQKRLRDWSWEAGWLFYSIAGMVLFPWLSVVLFIPNAGEVYARVGAAPLALAAVFGAGWGIGSVLFGLGIAWVGMALAFAVIISLTAAVGALVPLAILHSDQVMTSRGALLLLGLLIVIAGVALSSKAGALRESAEQRPKGNFLRGLIICIASGLTSPMMNFAVAFGDPLVKEAEKAGANPATSSIAVFAIAISSGFFINAGYCLWLLARKQSWPKRIGAGNILRTLAMGFLWFYGMYFYGMGAARLGPLGTSIGWPLFMTTMVLVANFWGILTGEWKNAGSRARGYLTAACAVMILALIVISLGTRA
jgi:L-rhamnose-H+ transport protein